MLQKCLSYKEERGLSVYHKVWVTAEPIGLCFSDILFTGLSMFLSYFLFGYGTNTPSRKLEDNYNIPKLIN